MPDEMQQVPIRYEYDIVTARQKVREIAIQIGFTGSDLTLIATAISEIARNIIVYASHGEITFNIIENRGSKGIVIVASDQGPGIKNIDQALSDGFSTGKSLGLGLPGAKRLMDEFEIDSSVGVGTTITMKKWLS
jgi:serine/threonine-protein kinase RsbT